MIFSSTYHSKSLFLRHKNHDDPSMKTLEQILAKKLLQIKAVKLQPANPFIWASGWKSPIYCDNRKTLSYPSIRNFIKVELARTIIEKYDDVGAVAGVATGAIAQGAMVAEELNLPFAYIRTTLKDHGLENLIEGDLKPGAKVVIIEDLISTGGSSLKAVEAIRNAGCHVLGLLAVFTYGFPIAEVKFNEAKVKWAALCNYDAILDEALKTEYIDESEIKTLQEWRKDPANWTGNKKI
jgi:orotate phosphoribosyltransferase